MKTKAIAFNAAELIGSVEAFARHVAGRQKLTLRAAVRPLPPVKPSRHPRRI